ncbi:hypothetical protein [Brassicibacter mesophilus]|uniref:hypothetical protein n=1 Tax=Brassicibacter mesophilus TaxID=745119 RepID=UPI003D24A6A5
MKNKILFSFGAIILIAVVLYISSNKNNKDAEIMWSSDNYDYTLKIFKIYNQETIQQVKQILNNAERLEDEPIFDIEPNYQFWISKEPPSDRTISCDLWFTSNKTVIFDLNKGEYFTIRYEEAQTLKNILESMKKEN